MDIKGYFTTQGLELAAKLAAGTVLTVTRVLAGGGTTAQSASALAQVKQTLAAGTPTYSGDTATIPVTLLAASAPADYTLTELGVYADDPDQGEILYKIYRLDTPVDVSAGSRLVLRFYLEETVSEDLDVEVLCSPAGLITETEFNPVRDKVFDTAVPTRTVSVAAAELPAYIAALPRLLTEHLTINVTGTLETALTIPFFYGSGSLTISASALGDATLSETLVRDCRCLVTFSNIAFQEIAGATYYSVILFSSWSNVILNNCSITGNHAEEPSTGAVGIAAQSGGRVFANLAAITNTSIALRARDNSVISCRTEIAENNGYGAQNYYGGIILLTGSTPDTVGGAANAKTGGGGVTINTAGQVI